MKDEINDLINKLVSYPKFNIGKYLLHDTVITQSKKIVTDSIKANAELQALSGLKPKIVRKSSGNCCKWCEEIAGTYIYPNVPDDVYRRHRGCTCTVEYFPGDGKVQNVHSKEWYKDESVEARENYENLNQHKFGKKVFITEQAINKVKPIGPKAYTSEQLSAIQEMNKQILKVAREKNASNEVAMIFDGNKISKPVLGNQYGVDIFADADMYHAIKGRDAKYRSLVLSHNHPGLSYFSTDDIGIFVANPSIGTIEVITNTGKTWFISKKDNYDDFKALEIFNSGARVNINNSKNIVEYFIKNAYNMIERNR